MKHLNENTVIGTAREIKSLYKKMVHRWDAGRSSWAPLYSDQPGFARHKIYGIMMEPEEGVIGLSGTFTVVGEHYIASQLL